MLLVADITITAGCVAWYGAIVATGSALVAAYAILRDRIRLKLRMQHSMRLVEPLGDYGTDRPYLLITAANVGRRPIQLGLVSFSLKNEKDKGLICRPDWNPSNEISEGKSATLLVDESTIVWEQVCHLNVETAGKVWRCKIRHSSHEK